ncbi:vacuolar iron transporter homolog 4 [Daucus carota subsp. sativus]|uniref:vacuolar iron transporter homolog 4 n=1 Tax=Daucus carota subsp. sativus TaxID=79200 RepID=UPI0007EF6E7C|nr:PREDICTED: vacuolar iron transporter homolog 4-like [Daucus carota subsp. sativus]
MMGVGAVLKHGISVMILTGFAGLVAGACSMAIGEFVSVYSQLDFEVAQTKRDNVMCNREENDTESGNEQPPNPFQAPLIRPWASAVAFSLGALVPLLAAAFISEHKVRLVVVIAAVTFALVVFGTVGAVLGKTPAGKSCARLLIGGWIAMAVTFGLTKLIASNGL